MVVGDREGDEDNEGEVCEITSVPPIKDDNENELVERGDVSLVNKDCDLDSSVDLFCVTCAKSSREAYDDDVFILGGLVLKTSDFDFCKDFGVVDVVTNGDESIERDDVSLDKMDPAFGEPHGEDEVLC